MKRVAIITTLAAIGIFAGWANQAVAQESLPGSTAEAGPTPVITPVPGRGVAPTPTFDRLAAPPTAVNPTQADEGAQLFWLHCQPCHGDQGQGLTDEWRAQYPEEDQNCWESGCHGNRPYENGFTLPTRVPAVIGSQSLERFETVGEVYSYVRAAMPFQNPGYLSAEIYLAITAYLARAHGVELDGPLTDENVHQLILNPGSAPPTSAAATRSPADQVTVEPQPDHTPSRDGVLLGFGPWLGIIGMLLAGAGIWLWRRRKP